MDDPELETSDSDDSIVADPPDVERPSRTSPHSSKDEPVVHDTSLPHSTRPSSPTSAQDSTTASHEQDYYKRWGFCCLLALIICLSLGITLFAIGLSILYDTNWAYVGILAGIAFAVGVALLWTVVMVVWSHNRPAIEKRFGIDNECGRRRLDIFEIGLAGVSFGFMVTAHGLFM